MKICLVTPEAAYCGPMGSDKRSIIAFEHYREGAQRFEYFILGTSAALCAYVGQTLTPQRIGLNPYTLEIFSLLVLVASVIAGFKRIERKIAVDLLNHRLLDTAERRAE